MRIKRQKLAVVLAVTAVFGISAACSPAESDDGGSGSTTISVLMPNYVLTDYIKTRLPEFTEETGIEVNLTTAGDDQLDDQFKVAMNARSTEMDVVNFRPMQNTQLYGRNGWLADLTPYLESAPAEYDVDDLQAGAMEAVTYEDTVIALPSTTERQILYYRKDLLQAAGLEVPQTMEELQHAVETLHDPANDVFGFVGRGAVSAAVTQLSGFLYAFGGDWSEGDVGTIASDEAIAAYEFYGGLLREYGPPGTQDMAWQQALPIFAQGRAAFYPEGDSFFTNFLDETQSVVSENVGYTVIPAGPAGSKPYSVPNTAYGISEFSENKDESWKFLEWATSVEMVLALQTEGIPQARQSAWDDESANEAFPEELREVIVKSIETGVSHDRPKVVQVSLARDIVGRPLIAAQNGEDVAEAAKKAELELTELIQSE